MLKKYWFFVGIAVMVGIAFSFPWVGLYLKQFYILNVLIFLAFFITGLTLETSSLFAQLRNPQVIGAALISSLILFPFAAYFLSSLFFQAWPDVVIGTLIIAAAPVTIASGTVMTAIALGNIPLSLFICIFGNFFSLLTIPIVLKLILQSGAASIELPVLDMLAGLSLKILLPALIGQLLRPCFKEQLPKCKSFFSVFNQVIVLFIILNAVSNSTQRILDAGLIILLVFIFMILLHILFLAFNNILTLLMRLDQPSAAAFTIHTSQKTLTVSYLVWSGYFAQAFPLALIPAICYHLTQMILDTLAAHHFREKQERLNAGQVGAFRKMEA